MKKFLKRLNGRKGFTLLECIIAIAVFAALTLVVMAMLTYARNEAVNANATEENLTTLIENIIEDDTQKKYYAGSDVLQLDIEGASGTFDVSYNVIDGYKNFIVCTSATCGYHGDNTEFMVDTEQQNFVQTDTFTCPKCGNANTIQLQCEECMAKGAHTDLNAFQYIPATGGFYCLKCGSANVRDPKSTELVVEEELISVNAMVANGVVYGKVLPNTTTEEKAKLIECFPMDPTTMQSPEIPLDLQSDANIQFNISYESNKSQTIPGVYTITVNKPMLTVPAADGSEVTAADFCLRINMPPYYKIIGLEQVNPTATDGIPRIICSEADDAPLGKNGYIDFKFESVGPGTLTAKFQLVNYKSGHSFDYDYAAESLFSDDGAAATLNGHGLGGHWFGSSVSSMNSVVKNEHPTQAASSVTITKPED